MERPVSQPDGRLRPKTWSLTGFLVGLILVPVPRDVKTVADIWVTSFIFGCFYMVVALVAALALNRFLESTKTVLPFYNSTRKQEWLFSLGLGISLILRSLPDPGALYVVFAALPIIIVMRGNR